MTTQLCENGWPVCAESDTSIFSAGGRQWQAKTGDVCTVLKMFINRYAKEVEPITGGKLDDWSYNIRLERGSSTTISNHAGYAIDINALAHPRGAREENFTLAKLTALRNLLKDFWVIRWGGDYKSPSVEDDMHFEINVSPERLREFVSAITARTPVGPTNAVTVVATSPVSVSRGVTAPAYPLQRGWYFGPRSGPKESVSGYISHTKDLATWQQRMKSRGWNINTDGHFDPLTEGVVLHFQAQCKLTVDGHIGPNTWAAAWVAPVVHTVAT